MENGEDIGELHPRFDSSKQRERKYRKRLWGMATRSGVGKSEAQTSIPVRDAHRGTFSTRKGIFK